MSQLRAIFSILIFVTGAAMAESTGDKYAEGQVWEYHTRPQDAGSLLKIQKIEKLPGLSETELVYHVSIIGVHFSGLPVAGTLGHLPFSKKSLDTSLTKLATSSPPFPDANDGIAQWKQAHGGVFTVTVAEAVDFAEQTIRRQMPSN